MKLLLACMSLFCLQNFVFAASATYVSMYNGSPLGLISYDLAIADISNDGELEIILANGNDQMVQPVSIYSVNGNTVNQTYPTWVSEKIQFGMGLVVADLDQDRKLDIAVAVSKGIFQNPSQGGVNLYYSGKADNSTPFSLPLTPISIVGFPGTDISAADIDADGDVDLLVSQNVDQAADAGDLKLLLNTRHGFTNAAWSSDGSGAYKLLVADINRDGYLDVVTLGLRLAVRYGRGVAPDEIPYSKKPDWSVDVGQHAYGLDLLNFRGCLNILISSTNGIQVFAPGSDKPVWEAANIDNVIAVLAYDIDGDGKDDFLASEYTHEVTDPTDACSAPGMPQGSSMNCLGGKITTYLQTKNRFERQSELPFPDLPLAVTQAMGIGAIYQSAVSKSQDFRSSSQRAVFTVDSDYVRTIKSVFVDRKELPPVNKQGIPNYTFTPGDNWISVVGSVPANTPVRIQYTTYDPLDVALAPALSGVGLRTYTNTNNQQEMTDESN